MSQAISIFNRPRLDADLPAPPALGISGTLANYTVGAAYSERLQIDNAIGKCTVALISSDLPSGALVYVDNFTKEVVVSWPAFSPTPISALQNGGFEEGNVAWQLAGPWEINNTGDAETGAYSAEFKKGTSGLFNMVGAAVPVSGATDITITGRVQQGASSSGNAGAGVGLRWYGAGGTLLADSYGAVVTSGSSGAWATATCSGSSPLGALRVAPLVSGFRWRENKPLWVDNLSWDHEYLAGDDSEDGYSLSLEVTDSAGRTALWAGTIEYAEVITDPYYGNVSALLHFDGADGSTTILDDIGNTWTQTGTSTSLDTSISKFGASSLEGVGLGGDTISTPTSARFGMGAGAFTIEGWYQPSDTFKEVQILIDTRAALSEGVGIYARSNIYNGLGYYSNAVNLQGASTGFPAGVMTHWAVVREEDGFTIRGYMGGVQVWSGVDARALASASPAVIGATPAGTQNVQGHIDELRVTKGVCRYPAGVSFTPPTTAGGVAEYPPYAYPAFANQVVGLHFDGVDGSTSFTDVTGITWAPFGSPEIDTANSQFGGASLLLPGSSFIGHTSATRFAYGTGDFCWAGWVRLGTTAGNQYIVSHEGNNGIISYSGDELHYYNPGVGLGALYYSGVTLAVGTRYYIEVSRVSGVTRLFVNGALRASQSDSYNYGGSVTVRFGAYSGGGDNSLTGGHLDDWGLWKGVGGHTASYLVPTFAFPDA